MPAPKNTPTPKCIVVNPHCLCVCVYVTPFNAKLAKLTQGYSHSVRPQEGSILTRFSPGARPHLLSVTGHLIQPARLNFISTSTDNRSRLDGCLCAPGPSPPSVFVHNSAVPGSRCPLTLAVSTAAASAAAAGGAWSFTTWLQLAGLIDRRRGALRVHACIKGPQIFLHMRSRFWSTTLSPYLFCHMKKKWHRRVKPPYIVH